MGVPLPTHLIPPQLSVWLLVHWRSGRSFTPRPEGAHILSPLWPHKESQVLRRAWLAALICYLWLISEALSHRWWSLAVNLIRPIFDGMYVCVCILVCVPLPQDAQVGPVVNMQRLFRWKAGHKSNGWRMKPSQADKSTYVKRKCMCTCVSMCMCDYMQKCTGLKPFVSAQSLLFASSTDTLLLLKFGGVTFVHFMCCTDWLVPTL